MHVDDCTIAASSLEVLTKLKHDLAAVYELVNLGEARWLLGYEIKRNRENQTLSMSQAAYVDQVLDRVNMTDCRTILVPMHPHERLNTVDPTEDKQKLMKDRPYATLVGSLMYAAVGTRPDIAFATSQLA